MKYHVAGLLFFQAIALIAASAFYVEHRLPPTDTPHAAAMSRIHTAGTTGPVAGSGTDRPLPKD